MTCPEFHALATRCQHPWDMTRAERAAFLRHGHECEPCCAWAIAQSQPGPPTPDQELRFSQMDVEDACDPEYREVSPEFSD